MVNMHSTLSILIFGILANVCFGSWEIQTINLCSDPTGVIAHSGIGYRTWHFLSSGCYINGTLNFTYTYISDYFWIYYSDLVKTKPTLQITGIPVPLWTKSDTPVPISVPITDKHRVAMLYDGYDPATVAAPAINISYHFENFDGIPTTNDKVAIDPSSSGTSRPTGSVTETPHENSSFADDPCICGGDTANQLKTFRGTTIGFGVLLFLGIPAAAMVYFRIRSNQPEGRASKNGGHVPAGLGKLSGLTMVSRILDSAQVFHAQLSTKGFTGSYSYLINKRRWQVFRNYSRSLQPIEASGTPSVVARTIRIEEEYAEVQKPSAGAQAEMKVNEVYELDIETTTSEPL